MGHYDIYDICGIARMCEWERDSYAQHIRMPQCAHIWTRHVQCLWMQPGDMHECGMAHMCARERDSCVPHMCAWERDSFVRIGISRTHGAGISRPSRTLLQHHSQCIWAYTYECGMAHMNFSHMWRVWISHANEWEIHVRTFECHTSIILTDVAHVNLSHKCQHYLCLHHSHHKSSHIWMSHVSSNGLTRTRHISMRHVTRECRPCRIWMSHRKT